jgi:peptidoglycan hydrolase CwlO-like protein
MNSEERNEIRKGFKIEWLLQIITLVFLVGVGYANLETVGALAEENKEKIEQEDQRSQEIEKKLVRIETRQERIAEDVDEVQDKLDAILTEVRKRNEE